MPGHRAAWGKFGPSEEITDLLKRNTILQGDAHQAGDYVLKTDQFSGAVWTFDAQEDFCGVPVVMHAEVERALASDSDFLRDVVAAGGESQARAHAASTIPWKGIPQR